MNKDRKLKYKQLSERFNTHRLNIAYAVGYFKDSGVTREQMIERQEEKIKRRVGYKDFLESITDNDFAEIMKDLLTPQRIKD